jgi:Tol biopolymer transport system component
MKPKDVMLVTILCALLAACGTSIPNPFATSTPKTDGGGGGHIAFTLNKATQQIGGGYLIDNHLLVLDINTRKAIELTEASGDSDDYAWLPDGRILYKGSGSADCKDQLGSRQLFIANADGSSPVRVLADATCVDSFALSSDGRQIVFAQYPYPSKGNVHLFTVNSDGTNRHEIPLADTSLTMIFGLNWSLADRIQFIASTGPQLSSRYIVNMDGTHLTQLEGSYTTYLSSPNGALVLLAEGNRITLQNSDSSNPRVIAQADSGSELSYWARQYGWSQDSKRFVYTKDVDCTASLPTPTGTPPYMNGLTSGCHVETIYMVDVDTLKATQVSGSSFQQNYGPAWSPDESRLAFVGWNPGNQGTYGTFGLYLMNPDGSNVTELYTSAHEIYDPIWQP